MVRRLTDMEFRIADTFTDSPARQATAFDAERISSSGRLFADEIENDPWCMFHGTSACNVPSIEKHGFAPGLGPSLKDGIAAIVDIFTKLKWCGDHGGGYPCLKPFSLDYDLAKPAGSPLFFAETSMRALLYACRDFAGGEKLRAVRHSLADLDKYLNDAAVREAHREGMAKQYDALAALNAHPDTLRDATPVTVDLGWLSAALAALQPIRRIADEAQRQHEAGVAFALRMTRDDLEGMAYNSAMGIEATRPIPASRIVDRVMVPGDHEFTGASRSPDDVVRRLQSGLVAALKSANNAAT